MREQPRETSELREFPAQFPAQPCASARLNPSYFPLWVPGDLSECPQPQLCPVGSQ